MASSKKRNPAGRIVIAAAALMVAIGVNKIAWQVLADKAAGRDSAYVIEHAFDDLSTPWPLLHLDKASLGATLIALALVVLAMIYKWATAGNYRHGEEHGSAKWGSPKDFAPFAPKAPRRQKGQGKPTRDEIKAAKAGLIFTAEHTLSLDTHQTRRNLNALVIGSSGSGKSRHYVMPNLARHATSYVVTDPKGELLRSAGADLEQAGYAIRSLNLVDFSASDTFNPFAYIDPRQPDVSLSVLVENIITNTNGGKPAAGDQQFWERAERALLTGLAAYAYHTRGEAATLPMVADLLAGIRPEDNDGETDQMFAALEVSGDGSVREAGLAYAASQYGIYMQGAPQTRQSIVISLGIRLSPLHMADLRRLLSSDTLGLQRLGTEKTALFMVTPDTNSAFDFLVAIAYDQLFETNIHLADSLPGGRLPHLVQCFMDEFANVGRIPRFERKIAVMRSRGISASIILQSYSQGKALYKDDWETIVGNCDSTLFLGGSEKSTTEYVSKLIGKETIDLRSTSEQHGQYGGYSVSGQKTGRDLITPDELARLDNEQCVYILRGLRPFLASKHTPIADGQPYAYLPQLPPVRAAVTFDDAVAPDTGGAGGYGGGPALTRTEEEAPPMLEADIEPEAEAAEEWTILPCADDEMLNRIHAIHTRSHAEPDNIEDATPALLAAD